LSGSLRAANPSIVAAADRAALQRYAEHRSQSRRQQVIARDRSFWTSKVLAGPGE
jgi:hypothetical protein